MHLSTRSWYILFALVALTPVGLRVMTWHSTNSQPVDPAMASAGDMLFQHNWTPHDPLANGGDGLGPVYNATSCIACHHQAGVGGSGGLEHNVTLFTAPSATDPQKLIQGVIHAGATSSQYRETLAMVDTQLPAVSRPALSDLVRLAGRNNHCLAMPSRVQISQRNTPALFGDKLIDEIPERLILANERAERLRWGMPKTADRDVPVGRALRLVDGRIGRFGWKAQSATLSDFVQAACANELGLGNPGNAQPSPLGRRDYQPPALDLTLEQCDQLTSFVASLPRPEVRLPDEPSARNTVESGQALFAKVGCADCHQPNIGSVEGIYSDLLLHAMGRDLQASGSYNGPPQRDPDGEPPDDEAAPDEWRTPPLWGVADSAPYMHDGRAATLDQAIAAHGGQGKRSATAFAKLGESEKTQLVAFLKTLRAPR